MSQKVAYLWGPISSFSGPLTNLLLRRGWHVHVACKPALNVFSLSPLDLHSSALTLLERALGGHQELRTFRDRLKLLNDGEVDRNTKYDALVFCGLPPNFDEPRTPRAPWAAGQLASISRLMTDVRLFIVSSVWAGVKDDGVVPEEIEFERRKPQTHWESVCQHYESKILKALKDIKAPWNLVRLPIVSGSGADGSSLNFSGLFTLLKELDRNDRSERFGDEPVELNYNPNSALPFLPIDAAVYLFSRLLDDQNRPRICNLVSTEATLNREWLNIVGKALGGRQIRPSDTDQFSLPTILRKMLTDDILVKTRNLFEVAGRYHLPHRRLDEEYFKRLIQKGRDADWGKSMEDTQEQAQLPFSHNLADTYFHKLLSSAGNEKLLEKITADDTSVAFIIDGDTQIAYCLRNVDGKYEAASLDENSEPTVRIHTTGRNFVKLITGSMSLNRALLLRQARLEGPILATMRLSGMLQELFAKNPYVQEAESETKTDTEEKEPEEAQPSKQ